MGLTLGRAAGAVLLVASYAPLHRLLDPTRTGPAGAATRASAESAWSIGVYGTLLVIGLAIVTSRLVPGSWLVAPVRTPLARLEAPSRSTFALCTGAVSFVLAAAVALLLFERTPTSVDEMAQLLHARVLTSGRLALPLPGDGASWVVQNGIVTPAGWASIYPPLHTLLLGAGLLAGPAWLLGPAATGGATALATLSFERLLGVGTGRVAGALLAVTPFWVTLGATHLSHSTAAFFLCAVLWAALRARDGRLGWSLACGAAIGAAVCTRPWVGLVCSVVLVTTVWVTSPLPPVRPSGWARRLAAVVAGGVPFATLLAWWNETLFGGPFALGYSAAFGPSHGLGFHTDPWGNQYGAIEALAYSGADLVQLGASLLQTPLPAVAVIGAGLLLLRMTSGASVFLAWSLAAVAANALYWHHGVHLGPRMLFESTPAWVALFVVAARELVARADSRRADRGVTAWVVAYCLLGGVVLVPGALAPIDATVRGEVTAVPEGAAAPAVIFVHGTWASRVAARLAADGMRRDSIETALRRNDICAVDRYARWRTGASALVEPPRLDLEPLPGTPPTLQTRLLSPGNPVRVSPTSPPDPACSREAAADRFGVVELELLLWRAPPLPGGEVVVARDLGPTTNEAMRDAIPGRAYVYVAGVGEAEPRLLDFDDGMELLWRGAAGSSR